MSPKQASIVSKPENAPKREKWGVQMCAGIKTASGQVSIVISSRSRLSSPRIGRPSEWMLPIASSFFERASAASRPGRRMRLWTLRTRPSFL